MTVKGKVFKYGDNVDTDVIIPARYLNASSPEHLKQHCMEDLDATFKDRVCDGDIIVAGNNFGCGSSREHAPLAIKASGIKLVIAKSFARIFYRNSLNTGLYITENAAIADETRDGDILEADLTRGLIKNLTLGTSYVIPRQSEFVQKLIENGGLVALSEKGLL